MRSDTFTFYLLVQFYFSIQHLSSTEIKSHTYLLAFYCLPSLPQYKLYFAHWFIPSIVELTNEWFIFGKRRTLHKPKSYMIFTGPHRKMLLHSGNMNIMLLGQIEKMLRVTGCVRGASLWDTGAWILILLYTRIYSVAF